MRQEANFSEMLTVVSTTMHHATELRGSARPFAPFLGQLFKALAPDAVLVLAADPGEAADSLAAIAQCNGSEVHVFGARADSVRVIEPSEVEPRSTTTVLLDLDCRYYFTDRSLDALVIWDPHTDDEVATFLRDWRSALSEKAVLMVRNANLHTVGTSVWRECRKLAESHPAVHLRLSPGLSAFVLGSQVPTAVTTLFTAIDGPWQNLFAELAMLLPTGNSPTDRPDGDTNLDTEIRALCAEVRTTTQRIDGSGQAVAALEKALAQRAQDADRARELASSLESLSHTLDSARATIERMGLEHDSLRNYVALLTQRLGRLVLARDRAELGRAALCARMAAADEQVEQLRAALEEQIAAKEVETQVSAGQRAIDPVPSVELAQSGPDPEALLAQLQEATREHNTLIRAREHERHLLAKAEADVTQLQHELHLLHNSAFYQVGRRWIDARQRYIDKMPLLPALINRARRPLVTSVPPTHLARATPDDLAVAGEGGAFSDVYLVGSDAPLVSIVVPAFNHIDYTLRCLASVAKHTTVPYEVIVVDDCSDEATKAAYTRFLHGCTVVCNEANVGFLRSIHAGVSKARGEFVLLLNNDTVVTPGWLEGLMDPFRIWSDVGMVGAKLVYPNGTLQEAGAIVWSDGTAWNVGRLADPGAPQFNYVREVDYCSGACLLLKKALWEDVGGFDLRYAPAYYEDTDLAFVIRRRGLKVLYSPFSEVIHFEGVTSGIDESGGEKRYQVINRDKFREKWAEVLSTHQPNGVQPERARDRYCRGRILIVDHMVPSPDRDSGSERMWSLIQILLEDGWKVTFLPHNLFAWEPYATRLRRIGVEVIVGPYYARVEDFIREHGYLYDAVWVSRLNVARDVMPLVNKWCAHGIKLFDTVDLVHLRERREAEIAGDMAAVRRAEERGGEELNIAVNADVAVVVSEVEASIVKRERPGARVVVVSNIHGIKEQGPPFQERAGILFVGGFRHPPNVDAALWFGREVWPHIQQALPGVRLYLVGDSPPREVVALAGGDVEVTGYVPDVGEYLRRVRVSIAPLRYGAGVKGKINQSMSFGVPVVATTIGVEGMHLNPGLEVLVADDPSSFAAAVLRVHEDEELWARLAEGGRRNIAAYFSKEVARRTLREILPQAERSGQGSVFGMRA